MNSHPMAAAAVAAKTLRLHDTHLVTPSLSGNYPQARALAVATESEGVPLDDSAIKQRVQQDPDLDTEGASV